MKGRDDRRISSAGIIMRDENNDAAAHEKSLEVGKAMHFRLQCWHKRLLLFEAGVSPPSFSQEMHRPTCVLELPRPQ